MSQERDRLRDRPPAADRPPHPGIRPRAPRPRPPVGRTPASSRAGPRGRRRAPAHRRPQGPERVAFRGPSGAPEPRPARAVRALTPLGTATAVAATVALFVGATLVTGFLTPRASSSDPASGGGPGRRALPGSFGGLRQGRWMGGRRPRRHGAPLRSLHGRHHRTPHRCRGPAHLGGGRLRAHLGGRQRRQRGLPHQPRHRQGGGSPDARGPGTGVARRRRRRGVGGRACWAEPSACSTPGPAR